MEKALVSLKVKRKILLKIQKKIFPIQKVKYIKIIFIKSDSKYKYKKNKQAFVKEQVLYPDDSVEEEVGRIKDLREYKHSNLENVKKSNFVFLIKNLNNSKIFNTLNEYILSLS